MANLYAQRGQQFAAEEDAKSEPSLSDRLKNWYIGLLKNGSPSAVADSKMDTAKFKEWGRSYRDGPRRDELAMPDMDFPPTGPGMPMEDDDDDEMKSLLAGDSGSRTSSAGASPARGSETGPDETPSSPQQLAGVSSRGDLQSDRYKDLKDMISKMEAKKGQFNLKPLLALTDAWTGSRLASQYDTPESEEERQYKIAALKQGLSEKEAMDAYRQAKIAADLEEAKIRSSDKKAGRDLQEKIAKIYSSGRVEAAKAREDKPKEPDLGKIGQTMFSPAKPALRQIFTLNADLLPKGTDMEAALPTMHNLVMSDAKQKYKSGDYEDFRQAYADSLKKYMTPPSQPES